MKLNPASEERAAALNVPCAAHRVDPGRRRAGCSSLERLTLQEAARELRYAALEEMARVQRATLASPCGSRE